MLEKIEKKMDDTVEHILKKNPENISLEEFQILEIRRRTIQDSIDKEKRDKELKKRLELISSM